MVKYEFIDRNNTIYPQGFADKLMEQLQYMENIVIKLVSAKITEKRDWNNTCKMSEDIGKVTGDKNTVKIFKEILHLT